MLLTSDYFLKQLRNKQALHFLFKMWTVCLILFLSVSCGKKGPPRLPELARPAAVEDLEMTRVSENTVRLTWSLPSGKKGSSADGFWVYRAEKPLADTECPDCPDEFEKIADVAVEFAFLGRPDTGYRYHDKVETGFRYRYKVMTYTKKGLTGNWSNVVEVKTSPEHPL